MSTSKTVTVGKKRIAARTTGVSKPKGFYAMVEGARPRAGARLYAHTHAALVFLGLFSGKSALRAAVEALIGKPAVKYHVDAANLAEKAGSVKLTPRGVKNFKARVETDRFDPDMAAAFVEAFSKKKCSEKYGILPEHFVLVEGIVV